MKGKQEFEMLPGHHQVTSATTFPILLSINAAPYQVLNGNQKFVVKLEEAQTISLDPTEPKREFKFDVRTFPAHRYEQIDDREVPAPPPTSNYLKALRAQVRMQMGLTREDFAEQPSIYQIGGNYDDIPFEETEKRLIEESARTQHEGDGELAETEPTTDEQPKGESETTKAETTQS